MLTVRAVDPRAATSEDVVTRFEVHIRDATGMRTTEFELSAEDPATPVSVIEVLAWCASEFGAEAEIELFAVLPSRSADDARPLVKLH